MHKTDHDLQIHQLKEQLCQLQKELSDKNKQLQTYLNRQCSESELPLEDNKQQQNKLYNHYKICDANWAKIPAGKFYSIEQKEVSLPVFEMLSTPVTFEMYDHYCAACKLQPPGDNGWGRENRPVININYYNARDYARWLSEQTGWHCQLPTEEQWEYACRAGTITHYWYGDNPDPRMMVMGTGKTMPTPGHRLANPWALYDMHGNVWEWTDSRKGGENILCGGSWYNKANWLSSSARNISFPNFSNNNWGFRLTRSVT